MPWYSIKYKALIKTQGRAVYHTHHVFARDMGQARRWWLNKRNYKSLGLVSIKRIKTSRREPGEFTKLV